ncbi:MAG: Ig-like domain-containing protein, partial [Chloroflexia bacterium]
SADVGYLFLPDRTRVDQIGWYSEYENGTFQRICDGEGPHDGYNWASSDGGRTWYDLPATLGSSNCAPYPVDAAVTKGGPATVYPGQWITYTLAVAMQTPRRGERLVITDTLPPEVAFVTFTSLLPVTWTGSVSPVVFQMDRLYGLQQNVITLIGQVGADTSPGAQLTNTVSLYCPGDTDLQNNHDTFASLVVGSDVGIAKTGPDFCLMGRPISYTLTYHVLGEPAQGVVITDVLPAAVAYVSDTAPIAPTQPAPGILVWALGTVTQTGSFVVYGLVSSDPMTWTIRNHVSVRATNDSWSGNNEAHWVTDLPMPISEVQAPSDPSGTWPSRHLGEHVYVLGVVIADSQAYPSAAGNPVRYVLGDLMEYGPWHGLFVYDPGRVVTEGQVLVLGGTVDEYYGMTELGSIDHFQVLFEDWPPPAPVLTSTAAITTANPWQAEPLESVLVEVRCAEVTHPNLGYGEWGIADESGVVARVDDMGDYAYAPRLGDLLWAVRGVLFYAYNDYKIEPRYDADILIAPTVQSTEPPPGAADVPVDAIVRATFGISLNPDTVNLSTFFLEGPAGLVSGTVGYDAATYTAVFTPAAALEYATSYVAHLTTGIQSAQGAAMCAEYTWSFTTRARPEPNLGPSFKVASADVVHPGETFTYTIRLINVGNLDAWATITDVLPLEVTPITATLPPGMVYEEGQLLWSGWVPQATQVPLAFQVRLSPEISQGGVITNTVWIADGTHPPFWREAYVTVEVPPYTIYLPLVFRGHNP